MSPFAAWIVGALGTLGGILGGVAAWRNAGSTKHRTVAEVYGDAIDRLDRISTEQGVRIGQLEADLTKERSHSRTQDQKIENLRATLRSWSVWGQGLHDNWPKIRLSEVPPDLPVRNTD